MSRLRDVLLQNRSSGIASLGIFTTLGYPVQAETGRILDAVVDGGADFVELGLPFSDPLAEGGTIQRSSERALASGVTLARAFATAAAFRARHETPLAFMGYVNPVIHYGTGNFFADAGSSGVDAVILPDLPLEEAEPFRMAAVGAGIDLVHLVAPTTPDERVRRIGALSRGFVYAVSVTGVTGSTMQDSAAVEGYLRRCRKLLSDNPLLVGFGITTHEDIERLSAIADGCIVGSAFIRELERIWKDPESPEDDRFDAVRRFVSKLKGVRRAEKERSGNMK